jgi:L-lysine exporter family protein LysE/ArgO
MGFSSLLFFEGFSLCFSLIVSVGMQNTFVLKQGILKNYNLLIASMCSVGYTILIVAGIYGFGMMIDDNAPLMASFHWGGIVLLMGYGTMSFYSAFKKNKTKLNTETKLLDLKNVILITLAVTFLNPNTYLEAFILIGSVSASFSDTDKLPFAIGAVGAAFIWFFLLSFGSRFLKPLFKKPLSWKILDFFIGCLMFTIAISFINKNIS